VNFEVWSDFGNTLAFAFKD